MIYVIEMENLTNLLSQWFTALKFLVLRIFNINLIIIVNSRKPSSPLKSLTSREKEIGFLEDFLIDHLDNEKSASLYISGQPGTGKTASLSYILQLDKVRKSVYGNTVIPIAK